MRGSIKVRLSHRNIHYYSEFSSFSGFCTILIKFSMIMWTIVGVQFARHIIKWGHKVLMCVEWGMLGIGEY